jgi:hypothetical protein
VLELRHVFFSRGLFGKMPGQHELGLEHGPAVLHHPVEGRGHPPDHRMLHLALNRGNRLPGLALVPGPVQMLGDDPELDDEVAGQVLGLGLAALSPPQLQEGLFVPAHDDPRVRAADEGPATGISGPP